MIDAVKPLFSVMDGTSGQAIQALVRVLYPDCTTALDMTYGKGRFWTEPTGLYVAGCDIDPKRAPYQVADFRDLPFEPKSFDLAVFDPPYLTDTGRGKPSVIGSRFGSFPTIEALKSAVRIGCKQARRVSRVGCIVKVQDYIHASRLVPMSLWVIEALGEPFDLLHLRSPSKIRDPKWTRQLSIWRNHATFLCFRWDGPEHKPRRKKP